MNSRHGSLGWIVFPVAMVCIAGQVPNLFGQTYDTNYGKPMTVAEVWTKIREMNTTVDMKPFQSPMTIRDALAALYEQMAKKGIDCPMLIDADAYRNKRPGIDVYSVPVKFSGLPRYIPLSRFFQEVCGQIPRGGGNCVIHRTCIVIVPGEKGSFRWWVATWWFPDRKVKPLQAPMI
jgi:hypothetical protein